MGWRSWCAGLVLAASQASVALAAGGPAAGATRLCPADPAASPALRELCSCPALGIDSERLQCFDRLTASTSQTLPGAYQEVSFTDIAADGDLLRHHKIRIGGFIMLTPTSVYLSRSALEIASAVKVDIDGLPRATRRVLFETCAQGCQGVFTGTLEGTEKAPEIKADNALPPS